MGNSAWVETQLNLHSHSTKKAPPVMKMHPPAAGVASIEERIRELLAIL